MARRPELKAKGLYWHSAVGGKSKYFGRVDKTPYEDAHLLFTQYISQLAPKTTAQTDTDTDAFSLLAQKYVEWMKKHRSKKNWVERRRHLNTLATIAPKMAGIEELTAEVVESFKDQLVSRGFAPSYVNKHLTSVRAAIRRGQKMGWVSESFKTPFDRVEFLRVTPNPLREEDLITRDEYQRLVEAAEESPYFDLGDLLVVLYNTGARIGELLTATVADLQHWKRSLDLDNHKRAHTLKEPRPRTIVLNDTAFNIVRRRCEGRAGDSPLFPSPSGDFYRTSDVDYRFSVIREAAKVSERRTLYGLRHLYISEMLMADVDPMVLARVCGTSVAMIERVYAHYRLASLNEAQDRLDVFREKRANRSGDDQNPEILKLKA